MVDETVGHFRVVREIGRGGMGRVYEAEDLKLQRRVALKLCTSRDPNASLLREAQVASSVNHPGIAVVYEVGEFERGGASETFIAMEYVEGKTLAQLRGSLPKDAILDYGSQAAEALQEAHLRGVVHRDVKPSNLMVTESGRIKILDFGLARSVPPVDENAPTLSGRPEDSGLLAGTIAYMSPEQARGLPVDPRTDVYSLGAVLHELLSGAPPFTGESAVELMDRVLHEAPPPPSYQGEPLDPLLSDLLLRMLAKDPEARPREMAEVASLLVALRAGEAPALPDPGRARIAVLAFKNITGRPDDDWLGTGIAETLTTDLKGVPGLIVLSRERLDELLRAPSFRGAPREALVSHFGRNVLVIEGGYQRIGEAVRVTAEVTDLQKGSVAKTVKIDGRMAELFALQDRIASELRASLGGGGSRPDDETEVVGAYEAYAKGLVNLKGESAEGMDRGILLFERAVHLDPHYARAHLQLGAARALKGEYLGLPELYQQALESLDRALALKPALAEAHREKGAVLIQLGRVDAGIEAIERALALDPGDFLNHSSLGRAYFIGKAQFARAVASYEFALRLNPQAGWSALQLSHCAALLRDLGKAEDAARKAIAEQEAFRSGRRGIVLVGAYMRLGHAFSLAGRSTEAREEYEKELTFLTRVDHALKGRVFIELQMRLAASLLSDGERETGEAALDRAIEAFERRVRLGSDEPATRYYAAAVYALRGRVPEALDSLERALRARPAFTAARVRIEPEFAALRSDPQLVSLLARMAP